MHYVELDEFVGQSYLVTVHGPLNPAVSQKLHSTPAERVLTASSSKRPTCRRSTPPARS